MSLQSIPKRAIVSIQPDPMGPYEFMDINDAEEMLNSRHVGGNPNLLLSNVCTANPGSCRSRIAGGKTKKRRSVKRRKRNSRKSRKN